MDFKSGSSMAKGQPIEAVAKTVQPSAAMLSRQTDRKSTRLNSSHLGISYAVFCLKKNHLEDLGASVVASDPVAMDNARPLLPRTELVDVLFYCVAGPEALVFFPERPYSV